MSPPCARAHARVASHVPRAGRVRHCDENVIFCAPRHRGAEGGKQFEWAFDRLMQTIQREFRDRDVLIQALAMPYHFAVGAWQACPVMARRCLHPVMSRENAEGKDLYQHINDLRDRRVITPWLAEAAQRVRVIGNPGAIRITLKVKRLNSWAWKMRETHLSFASGFLNRFIFNQES
jgi:hypothetical protein